MLPFLYSRHDAPSPSEEGEKRSLKTSLAGKAADYILPQMAFQYQVVPISCDTKTLVCGACSLDYELRQALCFHTGYAIELFLLSHDEYRELLYHLYGPDDETLYSLLLSIPDAREQRPLKSRVLSSSAEGRFFLSLVEYALARNVSDIHLLPTEAGVTMKARIQGTILEHPSQLVSLAVYKRLVQQLKISARLALYEKPRPETGVITIESFGHERKLRLNFIPGPHAELLVIRLPAFEEVPQLHALGLTHGVTTKLQRYLESQAGMLLICGPTGAGKTSLLYAMIQEAVQRQLHVLTVEDPIEQDIPGVSQSECRTSEMADYCIAALRHDPDILVPGEIRDSKSASIALEAALSGHAVMATLHAASIEEAFERMKQFSIKRSSLKKALHTILTIQLIPCVCTFCRVKHQTASTLCKTTVYQRLACTHCNFTGYRGRIPLIRIQSYKNNSTVTTVTPSDDLEDDGGKSYLEKLLYHGTIDIETYMRNRTPYESTTT